VLLRFESARHGDIKNPHLAGGGHRQLPCPQLRLHYVEDKPGHWPEGSSRIPERSRPVGWRGVSPRANEITPYRLRPLGEGELSGARRRSSAVQPPRPPIFGMSSAGGSLRKRKRYPCSGRPGGGTSPHVSPVNAVAGSRWTRSTNTPRRFERTKSSRRRRCHRVSRRGRIRRSEIGEGLAGKLRFAISAEALPRLDGRANFSERLIGNNVRTRPPFVGPFLHIFRHNCGNSCVR